MLSRADRILSELLISRGIVARDAVERCALERDGDTRHAALADSLAVSASIDPRVLEPLVEEARAIDRALIPSLPGGGRLGDLRIVREIGRGGMGIVFEAHHEILDRRMALKVLPAGAALDERLSIRFLREARAAARLDHPGIVRVLGSGASDGVLYFTMDLIDGPSLAEILKSGPLPPERAAGIASQVARGLSHAHASGLVHRDIKPENILIESGDRARITDFGLVHDASALPVTVSHLVLGTPAYMAPEQALGHRADPRGDVYSLGAVLYAMLAGRPPYRGDVPAVVLSRLLGEPFEPLASARPGMPLSIAAIAERALSREPADRYASASAMADDLERFLRGERPEASIARARRPMVARLAGAVLLTAAALAAGGYLAARRTVPTVLTLPPAEAVIEGTFSDLPATPGRKMRIGVAPDSRTVYFASDLSGNLDIYAQEADSGRTLNLTEGSTADDFSPALSTDGRSIAFASHRGTYGLYVMNADGGAVHRVSSIWSAPHGWSPDGALILVGDKERGASATPLGYYGGRITVVSARDGRARLLAGMDAADSAWSSDGRRISFLSRQGGGTDIWTVAPSGSGPSRLTDDRSEEWSPRFSADHRFLYYAGDRGGAIALWRLPIDTDTGAALGAPVRVTRTSFAAPFDLAVAADGQALFLVPYFSQETIHSLRFDPTARRVLGSPVLVAPDLVNVRGADLSPDGRRVVASLRIKGTPSENLILAEVGRLAHTLLTEGAFRDRSPRWSPDGARIAFESDRGGRFSIYSVRPDGSDVSLVASAPSGDAISPVWSPDGTRIAFGTVDGARIVTVENGQAAGAAEPMTTDPAWSSFTPSSWSTETQEIAGTSDGIAILSLRDRSFRRITDRGRHPVWIPGADGWVLDTEGSSILAYSSRSRERRRVFDASPNGLAPEISVAPDGRTIYLTLTSSDEKITKLTLGEVKGLLRE